MRNVLSLARSVYDGYKGDGERHSLRLVAALFAATIIGFKSVNLNKDSISTIAVIVSVLAGFSFTALFSNQSHSAADLHKPNNESDRLDIVTLKKLFKNFRDRSRYFLLISVVCLLSTFLISIPNSVFIYNININNKNLLDLIGVLNRIYVFFCGAMRIFTLLLFFEILYTFYRLAQTIFSILDLRRRYVDAVS